ncbi:hypothetical protein RND81_09G091500 [Saponaria officinalis]|uniref:Uncharacterized protein n=1 Tax=Saponaria officinalis TaxID=3572 RepID=A0AAW1IKP3_SAPOF
MAQRPFNMNKNELYIECHRPFKLPNSNYSGMIRVYELLNPQKQNMLTTMDWSFEPVIVDPNATSGYNSLEIDGQLVHLEKLVQDLCKSRLRVNKLGYCYFQVRRGVADTTETYGFAFYRMNDVLKWSDYGVALNPGKPNLMTWDRLDILHGGKSDLTEMEIHQTANDDTVIEQLKSKVQKLSDQVKELQAQLNSDSRVPESPKYPELNRSPVQPFMFNFITNLNDPYNVPKILQHWGTNLNNFGTYTPTTGLIVGMEGLRRLTISVKPGHQFDANNWYRVGVKELTTTILVYEGTAHSVTVAGHTMSSPLDGNAYIIQYVVNNNPPFLFGFLTLVGIGARIAIRYG